MTATRPWGTLTLLSQLSKSAIRKTPESLRHAPLRHYVALSYIAEQEGMAQQNLSEILMMDANNLVLLLNELEDEGLVRRVRDPADRRRHLVQVTEEGLSRFDRARQARTVVEDEVLSSLSAAERDDSSTAFAEGVGRLDRGPAPPMRSPTSSATSRSRAIRSPCSPMPTGWGMTSCSAPRVSSTSPRPFVLGADGDGGRRRAMGSSPRRSSFRSPGIRCWGRQNFVLGHRPRIGDVVRLRTNGGDQSRSRCAGGRGGGRLRRDGAAHLRVVLFGAEPELLAAMQVGAWGSGRSEDA